MLLWLGCKNGNSHSWPQLSFRSRTHQVPEGINGAEVISRAYKRYNLALGTGAKAS
jgi:hypothetical protein